MGQKWVRKTLEHSALQSPYNHGTAQDLHTNAVPYNGIPYHLQKSIVIEEVPDNWIEAVVPIFKKR